MRNKFGRSIKYKAKEGYYYDDDDVSFDIPLSSDDVETISMALGKLELFKNTTAFKNVKSSLDRLSSRLEIDLSNNSGSENIIYYEPVPDFAGKEWLSKIYDAVFHRHKISFSFHALDNKTDHTIEPYLLKEYSGRWYVAGKENEKAALFGLDRVRELKVLDKNFLFDDSFCYEMKFAVENSIGMLNFKKRKHPAIVRYDVSLAEEIKTTKIHESQKIVSEDSREIAVWFDANIDDDFMRRVVLPYGAKAIVDGPPFIVDKIVTIYEKALKNYEEYIKGRDEHVKKPE